MLNFTANDPSNPISILNLDTTRPDPCPNFLVVGDVVDSNVVSPAQEQSWYVRNVILSSLRFIQSKLNNKITKWSGINNLIVIPRAGRAANAFFDFTSLKFFFFPIDKTGKLIFLCQSFDVVCHELGHAVLTALRLDLWNTVSLEIAGFHEAFGDMNAMLCSLSFPEVIDFVLKETNNDIRKSNALSKLAEQFGLALMNHNWLRDAVNDFKYVSPEQLPHNAPENQLSCECHSFSRVFLSSFYDFLCLQYEKNLVNSNPHDSLMKTRDEVAEVLYNSLSIATNCPRFYDAFVRAMLVIDSTMENKCHDSIVKAFTDRGILLQQTNMTDYAIKMDGEELKTFTHENGSTVRVGGVKTLKLSDHLMMAQADNPLYSVDIDVPCEHYMEFDNMGMVAFQQPTILQDALESAKACVDYLYENDKVSMHDDPEKQFNVINNHLKRNRICH